MDSDHSLVAYLTGGKLPIVPMSQHRDWMRESGGGVAQRCLPLMMANQCGWALLNASTFTAVWDGDDEISGVRIEPEDSFTSSLPISHFGMGIITWHIPYLFRTPRGTQLWVKGPANAPKDGIAALEGIVEADWSRATFTMNWKFTRKGVPVTFAQGEPICVLVPLSLGSIECIEPRIESLSAAAQDVQDDYHHFAASRDAFNVDLRVADPAATRAKWQKHYFQGRYADGTLEEEHRTKIALKSFEDRATEERVGSPIHPLGH